MLVTLSCVVALSLIGAGTASAGYYNYNCGSVPPNGYCNPTIPDWGPVYGIGWTSTSINNNVTLPVRINRGSIGPTAWQWRVEGSYAYFPYRPEGLAQVKNTTSSTIQLTVHWID